MIYAELDIRNYTFRTISKTKREAYKTLKTYYLEQREPWNLSQNWLDFANSGNVRIYTLELNKITEE
jgi:hypothetical protein